MKLGKRLTYKNAGCHFKCPKMKPRKRQSLELHKFKKFKMKDYILSSNLETNLCNFDWFNWRRRLFVKRVIPTKVF